MFLGSVLTTLASVAGFVRLTNLYRTRRTAGGCCRCIPYVGRKAAANPQANTLDDSKFSFSTFVPSHLISSTSVLHCIIIEYVCSEAYAEYLKRREKRMRSAGRGVAKYHKAKNSDENLEIDI